MGFNMLCSILSIHGDNINKHLKLMHFVLSLHCSSTEQIGGQIQVGGGIQVLSLSLS